MRVALILLVLGLASGALSAERSYDSYKVYQVTPRNVAQFDALVQLQKAGESNIDFWTKVRALNVPADVMVSPSHQPIFNVLMKLHRIEYKEIIPNLERVFALERIAQSLAPKIEKGRISFTQYHTYGEIIDYLNGLAASYPDIVTVTAPGSTDEGRDIPLIKISSGGSGKPGILIDGGIHAREWIAPAMVTYIINQLVENPANAHMYADVDWYIVPVLNPDGYSFSHDSDRLWRKNRAEGTLCVGVDCNRNFDFHWMLTGASPFECDETYAGPSGNSERETQTIVGITESTANLQLYLTFHSYGQYLLYPWGWTSALPDDWRTLDALAQDVNDAISAVAGTEYTIGSSTNVLYAAAGGSDDWVKGVGGVALSYTIELPGGGLSGFDLPPSRITPVVEETWEGVKVYHQYIVDNFGRK